MCKTTSTPALGYCILIRGIFHRARISRIYAVYTADIRVLVPVRVTVLSLAVLYHMSASVVLYHVSNILQDICSIKSIFYTL